MFCQRIDKVLSIESFLDPAERVARVLSAEEVVFAAAFLEALSVIRKQSTITELAVLLEQGNFEGALARLNDAAEALGTVAAEQVTVSAAAAAAALSGSLVVNIRFDVTNERAVEAIRRNRLTLVREFTDQQRRVTTEVIADAISRGLNPREQARLFNRTIGLTTSQLRSVQNFRRLLEEGSKDVFDRDLRDRRFDRTILRAQEAGRLLTSEEVARMVERYTERAIRHRATVIARTEALRSANQGNHLLFAQAVEGGQVDGNLLIRTWRTAGDVRVRNSHASIEGQTVQGISSLFTTGQGNRLLYPGDPSAPGSDVISCRCTLATRIFSSQEGLEGFLAQRGLELAA